MCASNPLVIHSNVNTHDIQEGDMTSRSEIWNCEHPFPSVSGYKQRNDVKEVDITEFKVYIEVRKRAILSNFGVVQIHTYMGYIHHDMWTMSY